VTSINASSLKILATSAAGQTPLSDPMPNMSAKHPKADIWRPAGNVAEVPIGDMLSVSWHLGGDSLRGTYVPAEEPSQHQYRTLSGKNDAFIGRAPAEALSRTGVMAYRLIRLGASGGSATRPRRLSLRADQPAAVERFLACRIRAAGAQRP